MHRLGDRAVDLKGHYASHCSSQAREDHAGALRLTAAVQRDQQEKSVQPEVVVDHAVVDQDRQEVVEQSSRAFSKPRFQ